MLGVFYKEIDDGFFLFTLPDAHTRESLGEFEVLSHVFIRLCKHTHYLPFHKYKLTCTVVVIPRDIGTMLGVVIIIPGIVITPRNCHWFLRQPLSRGINGVI